MLFNDTFFCKRPVLIYLHARELFMFLFSSADFLQNLVFTNKPPGITIGVSNSLNPDQDRRGRSVGLHWVKNCLQKAIGRRQNSPLACELGASFNRPLLKNSFQMASVLLVSR